MMKWVNLSQKTLSVILLALIVVSATTTAVTALAAQYEPVRKIMITVRTTEDRGVLDVADGKIDIFLWAVSPRVLKQIPVDLSKLKLIPSSSGIYDIIFNPYSDDDEAGKWGVATDIDDGTKHFNPFALREVRFAMNFLINRKYIIDNILAGGGTPMYVGVGESNPFYKDKIEPVLKELGLTASGDESKALKMIDEALTKAAKELAKLGYKLYKADDGFWHFQAPGQDDEPVTVTFLVRIEDARKDIGEYVASLIEKAGIKVRIEYVERKTAALTVYFDDPRKLEWYIYTEGWGSTSDYIWPLDFIEFFASATYGFLPAISGWEYGMDEAEKRGDKIQVMLEQLALKTLQGNFKGPEDYWQTVANATKLAVEQSIRVFLTENLEYYVVNPRVHGIAAGSRTGLATPLALRTAENDIGYLVVAEFSARGALFMSAWNPVAGLNDMYSVMIWNQIHDYGSIRHPVTGEPIPVRATWKLEKNVTVPGDALVYDHAKHKWIESPKTGEVAPVKVVYNYKLGYWHDGHPVTLFDVLASIAWLWEWSYQDGDEDKWYYDEVASTFQPFFETVYGVEIINDTAIAFYGNYTHPVADYETAVYYLFWPDLPPEIYKAMEYIVLFKGPVSDKTYGWGSGEAERTVDILESEYQDDLIAALDAKYDAPWYTTTLKLASHSETAAVKAIKEFAKKYGHLVDSNGPFILTSYNPSELYLELERFDKYVLPPDYFKDKVSSYTVVIKDVKMPKTVLPPSFDVVVEVEKHYKYPEIMIEPAKDVEVEVNGVKAEPSGPGIFVATVELPKDITTGKYTVEVVVKEKGIVIAREEYTATVLAPTITFTQTTTSTPTPTTGPAPTPNVTVPSGTTVSMPKLVKVEPITAPTTILVAGIVLAIVVGLGVGLVVSKRFQ